MWWLYLDESGDLGFDFVNKSPSKFFTICILATSQRETNTVFKRAVRRTLRNKINPPRKRKRLVQELKGTATTPEMKQYVWRQVASAQYGIYALTLNKRRVYPQLAAEKDRVYNFIARQVVDRIPFEKASGNVQLIVDRSKGSKEIADFNQYITRALQGRIDPGVGLDFTHGDSQAWPGLQLADLFAWGIFRKYERRDNDWFDLFREKVLCDELYLK